MKYKIFDIKKRRGARNTIELRKKINNILFFTRRYFKYRWQRQFRYNQLRNNKTSQTCKRRKKWNWWKAFVCLIATKGVGRRFRNRTFTTAVWKMRLIVEKNPLDPKPGKRWRETCILARIWKVRYMLLNKRVFQVKHWLKKISIFYNWTLKTFINNYENKISSILIRLFDIRPKNYKLIAHLKHNPILIRTNKNPPYIIIKTNNLYIKYILNNSIIITQTFC